MNCQLQQWVSNAPDNPEHRPVPQKIKPDEARKKKKKNADTGRHGGTRRCKHFTASAPVNMHSCQRVKRDLAKKHRIRLLCSKLSVEMKKKNNNMHADM